MKRNENYGNIEKSGERKGNNRGYSEKMQMIFGDGMLSMNEVNRGIGVVSGN